MTGDIYLGKLLGIPFRLHWSWFLAVLLIAWTLSSAVFPQALPEFQGATGWYWALGLTAALGLFASVLLHELGHAVAARRCDVPVRGIRLFVFGGVAELGSEPRKPSHDILIAIAGPAVTVVLIGLFFLCLSLLTQVGGLTVESSDGVFHTVKAETALAAGSAAVMAYLALINGMVLLFNMIPAFPLDGGRVLRGVLWAVTGSYLKATRIAGGVGIAFSYLLFMGGFLMILGGNVFNGLWFFFLSMFLQNAAQSSVAFAQLQQLLRGVTVLDLMCPRPLTVPGEIPLQDAVQGYFLKYPYKAYPVLDDGEYLGMLTLKSVQGVDPERWPGVRARDAVVRQAQALSPRDPAVQALQTLAASGLSRLPVLDDGKLVGLLCLRDIMDFIEIRTGLSLTPNAMAWTGDGKALAEDAHVGAR